MVKLFRKITMFVFILQNLTEKKMLIICFSVGLGKKKVCKIPQMHRYFDGAYQSPQFNRRVR